MLVQVFINVLCHKKMHPFAGLPFSSSVLLSWYRNYLFFKYCRYSPKPRWWPSCFGPWEQIRTVPPSRWANLLQAWVVPPPLGRHTWDCTMTMSITLFPASAKSSPWEWKKLYMELAITNPQWKYIPVMCWEQISLISLGRKQWQALSGGISWCFIEVSSLNESLVATLWESNAVEIGNNSLLQPAMGKGIALHSSCCFSFCILQRRRDFLQWMLDSRDSDDYTAAACFDVISPSAASRQNEVPLAGRAPSEKVQKTLTEDEIAGQAFLFLIAGYETTTSTLSFATYLLATNPECQEKVLREIDEFSAKHVSMMWWCGASCREQDNVNVVMALWHMHGPYLSQLNMHILTFH